MAYQLSRMTLLTANISKTFIVEESRITDLEGIKKLLLQLVPEQNSNLGSMFMDLSESIKSNNNKWFVIRNDERVVGCCQLLIYKNLIRSPNQKAVIDSVIIDEHHQSIGLGQLLIKNVLKYAKAYHVGKVQLISSFPRIKAHSFYERLAFKKVGYGFILDLNTQNG